MGFFFFFSFPRFLLSNVEENGFQLWGIEYCIPFYENLIANFITRLEKKKKKSVSKSPSVSSTRRPTALHIQITIAQRL